MKKQIKLEYNGVEYTLEFTRASATIMEQNNFNIDEVNDKPIEMLTKLFDGAFLAHHPKMEESLKQEIFEQIPKKDELVPKLVEMYNETVISLFGDNPEGKAKWEVNW